MVQVLFLYIENETVDCWLGLRALKTLYFYFCKVIKKKKKLKGFFQRILQEIMKKMILGTIILKIVDFLELQTYWKTKSSGC